MKNRKSLNVYFWFYLWSHANSLPETLQGAIFTLELDYPTCLF